MMRRGWGGAVNLTQISGDGVQVLLVVSHTRRPCCCGVTHAASVVDVPCRQNRHEKSGNVREK